MQVIVGLGNPGKKYDKNRHNVGFKAIDLIAKKNNFGPWRRKFQSKISEGLIKSNKILLVKPETYMNNSGFAIKELFLFFKLNSDDLVVIHDDLDLKVGKIKAKVGGGHAGHPVPHGLQGPHAANERHRAAGRTRSTAIANTVGPCEQGARLFFG